MFHPPPLSTYTITHTELMKCKQYSLQTFATKMEFALYKTVTTHTCDTDTHITALIGVICPLQ